MTLGHMQGTKLYLVPSIQEMQDSGSITGMLIYTDFYAVVP